MLRDHTSYIQELTLCQRLYLSGHSFQCGKHMHYTWELSIFNLLWKFITICHRDCINLHSHQQYTWAPFSSPPHQTWFHDFSGSIFLGHTGNAQGLHWVLRLCNQGALFMGPRPIRYTIDCVWVIRLLYLLLLSLWSLIFLMYQNVFINVNMWRDICDFDLFFPKISDDDHLKYYCERFVVCFGKKKKNY